MVKRLKNTTLKSWKKMVSVILMKSFISTIKLVVMFGMVSDNSYKNMKKFLVVKRTI